MRNRDNLGWRLISKVPVLGRLREVPSEALREARHEVASTLFFAGMPFWFPMVANLLFDQPLPFLHGVRNGDLFIYAASLVGPITYITTKRYGRHVAPNDDPEQPDIPLSYPFPYGRSAVTIAMVICIVSGLVLTLQRLQFIPQIQSLKLVNETSLSVISVVSLLVSTVLIFAVSSYRNFIELLAEKHSNKISNAQREDENSIMSAWKQRRDGQ